MKFYPGLEFEDSGVRYRVIKGGLGEADMVIQFYASGWHQPRISHTLILASFKAQVEDNNYLKTGKGIGSEYLLKAIKESFTSGWESVAARIKAEAQNAREKRKEAANVAKGVAEFKRDIELLREGKL